MKRTAVVAAAVLILGGVLAARFFALDADPDVTLTWSKVFYTDEQGYSSNAVRKYVSGNWRFDGNDHMVIMPVIPCLQYLLFKAAGMSLLSARMPVTALSLIGILVGFLFLRSLPCRRRSALLIFMLLAATNYYYLVYSRLALIDVAMYAFGLCSGYAFFLAGQARSDMKRRLLSVASGTLLGVCVLTKTTGVIFFAAIPLAYGLTRIGTGDKGQRRGVLSLAGVMLVGLAVVMLALTFTSALGYDFFRLKANAIDAYIDWSWRGAAGHYAQLMHNGFLKVNAGILALALGGCAAVSVRALRERRIRYGDAFFVSLPAVQLILHGFFGSQEPRYFVALAIPAAYLAARLFAELREGALRRTVVPLFMAGLLAANYWNMARAAAYFFRLEYSVRDLGPRLARDIAADSGAGPFIITGRFAPLAGLTGANPVDIVYDHASLPPRRDVPVYVLDWAAAASPVDASEELMFKGSYRILKGYNGVEFRLFRVAG